MNDVRESIQSFLQKSLKRPPESASVDLFEGGFVNSLFAMQLIVFLEKILGRRIPGREIKRENMKSVDAMALWMERLRATG